MGRDLPKMVRTAVVMSLALASLSHAQGPVTENARDVTEQDVPPLLLITGDRKMEMLGRYAENAYMWRMMQVIGHPDTELFELEGYNHGQMANPAHPLLLTFVRTHSGE